MNRFCRFLFLTAFLASAASANVLNLSYTGVNGSVSQAFNFSVISPARLVFEPSYMPIAPSCNGSCLSSAGVFFNGAGAAATNDCQVVGAPCLYDLNGGISALIADYPVGNYSVDARINVYSFGSALPTTSYISVDMIVLSGVVQPNATGPAAVPEPATWLMLIPVAGMWWRRKFS